MEAITGPLSRREYCKYAIPAGEANQPTIRHILEQNAGIANGTVKGTTINLKFLGIGNGLTVSHSITVAPIRDHGTVLTMYLRYRTLLRSTRVI